MHTERERQREYLHSEKLFFAGTGKWRLHSGSWKLPAGAEAAVWTGFLLREPSLFSIEASQLTEMAHCKDNLHLRITECNCKP